MVSKNRTKDGVAMWIPSPMEKKGRREAVDSEGWTTAGRSPSGGNLCGILHNTAAPVERGFVSSKSLRSWLHRGLFSEACVCELRLVTPRSLSGNSYNTHVPLIIPEDIKHLVPCKAFFFLSRTQIPLSSLFNKPSCD